MINSNWITQALSVAAQLSLPDLLASGPKSSASLAQAAGVHDPSLHRLLRALVTLDIVRERADGNYELLPMGALLRSDAALSLRAWAILVGRNRWEAWGHLLDSVKTGASALDDACRLSTSPEVSSPHRRARN
jgi:orsellinic acid C2-O-methyltransferase